MAKSKNSRSYQRKFTSPKAQAMWDELDATPSADLAQLVKSVGASVEAKQKQTTAKKQKTKVQREQIIKKLVDTDAARAEVEAKEVNTLAATQEEISKLLDVALAQSKEAESELNRIKDLRKRTEAELVRQNIAEAKALASDKAELVQESKSITVAELAQQYQGFKHRLLEAIRNPSGVNVVELSGIKLAHKNLYKAANEVLKNEPTQKTSFIKKLDLKKRWIVVLENLVRTESANDKAADKEINTPNAPDVFGWQISQKSLYRKRKAKAGAKAEGLMSKGAKRGRSLLGDRDAGYSKKGLGSKLKDGVLSSDLSVPRGFNDSVVAKGLNLVGKSIAGVASAVKAVGYDAPKWLFKKLDGLTRTLMRWIKKPFELAERGGGLLGKLFTAAAFMPFISALIDGMDSELKKMYGENYISNFISGLWDKAWTYISDKVSSWLDLENIKKFLIESWETASKFVSETWDTASTYAIEKWKQASAYLTEKWAQTSEYLTKKWDQASTYVLKKWDQASAYVIETWDAIRKFLGIKTEEEKQQDTITNLAETTKAAETAATAYEQESTPENRRKLEQAERAKSAAAVSVEIANNGTFAGQIAAKLNYINNAKGVKKTQAITNLQNVINESSELVPAGLVPELEKVGIKVGYEKTDTFGSSTLAPSGKSDWDVGIPMGAMSASTSASSKKPVVTASPPIATAAPTTAPMDKEPVIASSPAATTMTPEAGAVKNAPTQGPNGFGVSQIPTNAVRDNMAFYNSVGFGQ
jgi:hypothetical protein